MLPREVRTTIVIKCRPILFFLLSLAGILTDEDVGFYDSVLRKRNLSEY